ncbi:hypothetical protein E2C01_021723 [Portunus trituberculatus]|uniref:Uncharacterized protein n=1 Tax=Portunus trituberculatus TaxID=210409 RepID=A0A5B7E5A2_PORTR|nr:hypothetical protein [Portunus trituberculatus]
MENKLGVLKTQLIIPVTFGNTRMAVEDSATLPRVIYSTWAELAGFLPPFTPTTETKAPIFFVC